MLCCIVPTCCMLCCIPPLILSIPPGMLPFIMRGVRMGLEVLPKRELKGGTLLLGKLLLKLLFRLLTLRTDDPFNNPSADDCLADSTVETMPIEGCP